jgi:CheY-like chemotaxis protein
VLVVEDDPSVRLLIGEVLRELGYSCLEASDGQAAIPLLASSVRMDLMITDVGLPGLNGRLLAEIAREHRRDLRILFVTGYAEHATDRGRFLAPGMEMITKPFTLDALAIRIREMIGVPV